VQSERHSSEKRTDNYQWIPATSFRSTRNPQDPTNEGKFLSCTMGENENGTKWKNSFIADFNSCSKEYSTFDTTNRFVSKMRLVFMDFNNFLKI
jgi:hypothetical protein